MNQRSSTIRVGAVLVCVLVCVGVASTIMLTSLHASLRERRQMRQELQMEQTRWLVEAAMIRGTRATRDQDDYRGETWNVSAALRKYAQAEVTINVSPVAGSNGEVQLDVTAEIRGPDSRSNITKHSGRMILSLSDQ